MNGTSTAELLREIEEFLRVTGRTAHWLSLNSIQDPSFVSRLRHGLGASLEKADGVRAFMRAERLAEIERCRERLRKLEGKT